MSANALQDLRGKIEVKRNRVAELFACKHADGSYNLTAAQVDEVKSLNKELNEDLGPKLDQQVALAKHEADNAAALAAMKSVAHPAGHGQAIAGGDGFALTRDGRVVSMTPAAKSLGELFVDSASFKSLRQAAAAGEHGAMKRLSVALNEVDLKTIFSRAAGWDPFVARQPGVVLSAQQQPAVADLIPLSETAQAAVKWMLETTYTNNAAETAEGGNSPESAFALTEQTTPVNKIAVTLPLTDEQLEDEPRARDYLNNRLTLNLKQRLDMQLLVGNGTAPNLRGLLNLAGIQTYAKGAEPDFDAFFKAMVRVQTVGFTNVSGAIMNPIDWQNIRLIRSGGLYVLGNPGDDIGPRLFGQPIVLTTYMPQGTGMVADFVGFTELVYRRGISFDMSNSHAAEFVAGVQRMRASLRVALVVTRPSAVCTFTGLTGT